MTFHWTTFALQLVNVLILLAILRHFLFRPVAAIIAARQAQTQAVLDAAETARAGAAAAEAAARAEHEAIAARRAALLAQAADEAAAARAAALTAARAEAARLIDEGRAARQAEAAAAEAQALDRARALADSIARRLLADQPRDLAGWLARLSAGLAAMPEAERRALLAGADLRLTSAAPLTEAQRATAAAALPQMARARFDTDPDMLAGVEIRAASGALRNSLAHDLDLIARAMRDDPTP